MSTEGCRRGHVHVPDTESMTTKTVDRTARAVEDSELEAEVLLTASAQSLGEETTATIVATAVGAMIVMTATDSMTVTVTMIAMNVAGVATEAETIDVPIVDTKSTNSMTTSPSLILRVMDRLWSDAGRRLSREGTCEYALSNVAERRYDCTTGLGTMRFCSLLSFSG